MSANQIGFLHRPTLPNIARGLTGARDEQRTMA